MVLGNLLKGLKMWKKTQVDDDGCFYELPPLNAVVMAKKGKIKEMAVFKERLPKERTQDHPCQFYFKLIDDHTLEADQGIYWQKTERVLNIDPTIEEERTQAYQSAREEFYQLFYRHHFDIHAMLWLVKMILERIEEMRGTPKDVGYSLALSLKKLQIALEIERDQLP